MAFVRWNETTQIWEKAVTPENPSTAWNHLPIGTPTQPGDTVNKAYVDAAVAGVSGFVPYVGATAHVNLGGTFGLTARYVIGTGSVIAGPVDTNRALSVSSSAAAGDLGISTFNNAAEYVSANASNLAATTEHRFYVRNGTVANVLVFQVYPGTARVLGNLVVDGQIVEQSRGQYMGNWGTYTPRWRGYGGSDGVIGNGTLLGRFSRVGKTVTVTIQLFIGSTTTMAPSHWSFELPFPAINTAIQGSAVIYDGTTGSIFGATIVPGGYFFGHPNSMGLVCSNFLNPPGSNSFVNPGYPWAWKTNDSLFITCTYEQS